MSNEVHHLGTVKLKLRDKEVEALELKPFFETKSCLRDWPTDSRYFNVEKEKDLVVFKDGLFTTNGSLVECRFSE